VDNAIVVVRPWAGTAGGEPRSSGARATDEVRPLIAGTPTTLLVFGPIVFVRGLAVALFLTCRLPSATVGASPSSRSH
jgi:multidrug efflux pump subunit AcrB